MDVEELGGAPVETHTLALVEVTFAVVVGDALLGAGTVETVLRDTYKRTTIHKQGASLPAAWG